MKTEIPWPFFVHICKQLRKATCCLFNAFLSFSFQFTFIGPKIIPFYHQIHNKRYYKTHYVIWVTILIEYKLFCSARHKIDQFHIWFEIYYPYEYIDTFMIPSIYLYKFLVYSIRSFSIQDILLNRTRVRFYSR